MKSDSSAYCNCFEVLGNRLRIDLINELMRTPHSVSELALLLDAEQSRVSHSLDALRKCGFVEARREGKKMIYTVPAGFAKKVKERGIFAALEMHYASHAGECWRCEE
ncbi:MAG: winged helix-turn-helix domain-containing protein [Candidatus Diapherotrites archaeon]|nr:winged helix-turn-helix domain-containing protein [Candidatus Diapherotrites archaeon]